MTTRATDTAPTAAHFRRISSAEFAALWADHSITRAEIGRRVNLCEKAVTKRAVALGLPLRGQGSKKPSLKPADEPLFRDLWRAGVSAAEIAERFGFKYRTVANTCARLKLPKRPPGQRPKMTMAQYRETLLGRAMARAAAIEQGAIINADMADQIGYNVVGAKKARAA